MCSGHGGNCDYVECKACHKAEADDEVADTKEAHLWSKELENVPIFPFHSYNPGTIHVSTSDPLELFLLFITHDDLIRILKATNAHGNNKYNKLKVKHTHHTPINTHNQS